MCKNNSESQHGVPQTETPLLGNVLINLFSHRKQALSISLQSRSRLNQFKKLSYAHRALAEKAHLDAESLLTPV